MTRKQIKIVILVLQAALVGMMFLPAGRDISSGADLLDSFEIIWLYGGTSLQTDATVYLVLAVCMPVGTVGCLFLLKREKLRFGSAACLQALGAFITGCFFSSAARKLTGSVTMTGLHYMIIFLYLAGMVLNIYGYLFTGKDTRTS